jgi:phenylpyruvate tautomerase PptA (4-oxalocrotonate tautomerase family)
MMDYGADASLSTLAPRGRVTYGCPVAVAAIEVLAGRSPAEKRLLLDAVLEALVVSLRVPRQDPTVRLIERAAEDVIIPPRYSERFTMVVVTMFEGRTAATKRHLYRSIVAGLGGAGVPSQDVLIMVHELPMANWGVEGGTPANEVDVGFRVDV